jgi:hypothetical protein
MPAETRCGARLTSLKARIVDLVSRAGDGDTSAADIGGIIGATNPNTLKAHIISLTRHWRKAELRFAVLPAVTC